MCTHTATQRLSFFLRVLDLKKSLLHFKTTEQHKQMAAVMRSNRRIKKSSNYCSGAYMHVADQCVADAVAEQNKAAHAN